MIENPTKLLQALLLFGSERFKKTKTNAGVILKVKDGISIEASKQAWEQVEPKLVEVEDGVYVLFGDSDSDGANDPVIDDFDVAAEWVERAGPGSYPNETNHSRKIYNLFVTTTCKVRTKASSKAELRWVRVISPFGSLLNETYNDFSGEDEDELHLRRKIGNSAQPGLKQGGSFKVTLELTAETLERNPNGGVMNRKVYKSDKRKTLVITPAP